MKKIITVVAVFLCGCLLLQHSSLFAQTKDEKGPVMVGETLSSDEEIKHIDENGNIVVYDKDELNKKTMQEQSARNKLKKSYGYGGAKNISYGVVNFRTKNVSQNTNYKVYGTNESGYINGHYGADGAFLGYTNNGTKVKFMLSGVIGEVNASEVEVLEYDDVNSVNYYACRNGILYHDITIDVRSPYYASSLVVGEKQSYMKNNTPYYSYDGHYFYTSYKKMIDDYKAGTRKNSINPSDPYYNYYQFVSTRTKTSFTAADINGFLKSRLGSSYTAKDTKLYEMGKYFIEYQNTYGAYALSTLAVAINESNFGTSTYALTKNNLFGHNAVDSNPDLASSYASPQDSIKAHAKVYVNMWYSTPGYYSYHGAFLGDKASGMNVSYASDPYWGEKAASWMWRLDFYSSKTDAYTKTLGITNSSDVNIRKEATTASTSLCKTIVGGNSFIVLEKVEGQSVNGSKIWYKIQLDAPLNSSRTAIDTSGNSYNFNNSYGYIHSSYLNVLGNVSSGSGGSSGGDTGTPTYKLGDVNNDGKISSMDYVLIKNHILDIKKLSGNAKTAADVNKDNKISSMDYVLVKNHILGIKEIKE